MHGWKIETREDRDRPAMWGHATFFEPRGYKWRWDCRQNGSPKRKIRQGGWIGIISPPFFYFDTLRLEGLLTCWLYALWNNMSKVSHKYD